MVQANLAWRGSFVELREGRRVRRKGRFYLINIYKQFISQFWMTRGDFSVTGSESEKVKASIYLVNHHPLSTADDFQDYVVSVLRVLERIPIDSSPKELEHLARTGTLIPEGRAVVLDYRPFDGQGVSYRVGDRYVLENSFGGEKRVHDIPRGIYTRDEIMAEDFSLDR